MEKQFRTQSLQTGAFLLSTGAAFVGCERAGINRVEFVFRDDGTLQDQANAYFSGATVIGRRFYKNLIALKQAIEKTMGVSDERRG